MSKRNANKTHVTVSARMEYDRDPINREAIIRKIVVYASADNGATFTPSAYYGTKAEDAIKDYRKNHKNDFRGTVVKIADHTADDSKQIDSMIAENINTDHAWTGALKSGINPFEKSHFSTAVYSDVLGTPAEKLVNKKGQIRVKVSAPEFKRAVVNVREKIENGDYKGLVTAKMLYELREAEEFIRDIIEADRKASDPNWKTDDYNTIEDVFRDTNAFQTRAKNAVRHLHKKHKNAVDRVLKTSADYDEVIAEMYCKYADNPDAYSDLEKGISFNMNTLATDALTAVMKERGIHRGSFGTDADGKRVRGYIADGDVSLDQTVKNDDGDECTLSMFMVAKNNTEAEAIAHYMRGDRRAENRQIVSEMTRIGRVICSEFIKAYRRMENRIIDEGARRLAEETVLSEVRKQLGLSKKQYLSERNKLFALFVKYGKRPDHRDSKAYENGVCRTAW